MNDITAVAALAARVADVNADRATEGRAPDEDDGLRQFVYEAVSRFVETELGLDADELGNQIAEFVDAEFWRGG